MTTSQLNLRGFILYATILPLAIFMGYLMANPLSASSFMWMGVVLLALVTPLILRWHHPVLFLSWNMTAVVFIPGRPQFWLIMAFVSLGISIMQYALTRKLEFVKTRSVLYPILFIGAVVFVTAQLTGGIGLRAMGGDQVGGRRYFYFFAAIAGYLAMTAHPIPQSRAVLYLGLFLLGAVTNAIGNLVAYLPPVFYPIFAIFPVESQGVTAALSHDSVTAKEGISRFYGLSLALMGLAYFFVAKHGMERLLSLRKPVFWIFVIALISSTLGGFRSFLILSLLTLALVFVLEGLHRSRKMPVVLIALLLGLVTVVAFSEKMPFSIQRSLSFLPIRVDPAVEMDARRSSEWRLEMWQEIYPEVPRHLLLGKGLSIRRGDLELITTLERQGRANSAETAMLAGDFHSGPLSVIIPFGLWGALAWIWFAVAGVRALYFNHRNGDAQLKTINTFILAYFVAKLILFHAVFGSFHTEFPFFVGILGFSIALNGGIRKPAPVTETSPESLHGPLSRPRLIPSFSRLGQK